MTTCAQRGFRSSSHGGAATARSFEICRDHVARPHLSPSSSLQCPPSRRSPPAPTTSRALHECRQPDPDLNLSFSTSAKHYKSSLVQVSLSELPGLAASLHAHELRPLIIKATMSPPSTSTASGSDEHGYRIVDDDGGHALPPPPCPTLLVLRLLPVPPRYRPQTPTSSCQLCHPHPHPCSRPQTCLPRGVSLRCQLIVVGGRSRSAAHACITTRPRPNAATRAHPYRAVWHIVGVTQRRSSSGERRAAKAGAPVQRARGNLSISCTCIPCPLCHSYPHVHTHTDLALSRPLFRSLCLPATFTQPHFSLSHSPSLSPLPSLTQTSHCRCTR